MQNNILLLPLPFLNQSRGLQKDKDNAVLGQEEGLSLLEKPKVHSQALDPLGVAGSRIPRAPGLKNPSFRVCMSKIPTVIVEQQRNTFCILSVHILVYIKVLPHYQEINSQ